MIIIRTIKKYKAIAFPIFDSLINAINLFSHIFISWFVSSNNYGVLNALLSFSAILMVVGVALQTFIAKRVSDPNWDVCSFKAIKKLSNRIILMMTLILVLLAPVLRIVLRSNLALVLTVVIIFFVNSNLSIYRGVLQGEKRFLLLNRSFYIEAIVRVVLTMVLFTLFNNIIMALVSILIGMISAFSVDVKCVRKLYINVEDKAVITSQQIYSKDLNIILAANFFFYYFTSISIIVVNYFLPELSGLFAVSVKYSQVFVHIGCSIITVIIPVISKYKYNYKDFKKYAFLYLSICIGMGAIGLLFYRFVLPNTVVMIFGEQYQGAEKLIFIQGVGYFIFIISHYLVSMDIIIERDKFLKYLIVAGIMMTMGLMVLNNSLIQVIVVEISTFSVLMIALVFNFIKGGITYENQ